MKKQLWFVLLLCIALLLTACTATDPNNLFETTAGDPAEATTSATASTEPNTQSGTNELDSSVTFERGYQYGNMQKNIPSGDYMLWGNEVLFQVCSNGRFIMYSYELTTGEVAPLCKDATCRHRDCVAGGVFCNTEVYKGKAYSLSSGHQIIEIKDDEQELVAKAGVISFFHHDNKLYIRSMDNSFVVLEENGEMRELIEEFTGYWNLIFGQYMYATGSDSVLRYDLTAAEPEAEILVSNAGGITDGQHIYYTDYDTCYLHRCDMDGSNVQCLLDQPVLLASMNFDDEYFYYRLFTDYQLDEGPDTYDIYRFSKSDPTKIEKLATMPVPAYQVFTVPGTGKLFVHTRTCSNGENPDIYVMNTDGSDVTRLEIPEY